jgi:phycocyanobilin lyase subunit alpha
MDEGLVAGAALTIGQAIEHLIGPDTGLRFYAAWWLGRFKVTDQRAVDYLIAALGDEDDRTSDGGYPLRRNAARALGKIGNVQAIPALTIALGSSDFYVREAAAQSLEMLGAVESVTELVNLVRHGLGADGDLVREQPDMAEPYDALLETLGTLGAVEDLRDLRDSGLGGEGAGSAPLRGVITPFLGHPIGRTRYAANRAMYQLTGGEEYGNVLIEALRGDDLQLRRAALTDVGAIGYLPAAEAIAATLAENSLKLIALKGLLEKQVNLASPTQLSAGAIQVMNLMDGLL